LKSELQQQTVRGVIDAVARRLKDARLAFGHGTANARDEAGWLVCHACGIPFGFDSGRSVAASELRRIGKLVDRRIDERIPAAYLTHEAWLGEFKFYVDRRAIVPRSFIAELVPEGIEPFMRRPVKTALDLCTGSGCLAVVLAHAYPSAAIDAVDLSAAALAVAKKNVSAYRLGRRIRIVKSDLFRGLKARRYDLIVSNPPYVAKASMKRLPEEYRREPRMALAGGEDGLLLVRQILAHARLHLNAGGILLCEIGNNRKALERSYPRTPFVWLETSAGDGLVFLLERDALPA